MHKREPGIIYAVCICVHVLVETEKSPFVTEAGYDGSRMSAAAESYVHIRSVGLDVKSVDAFAQ